MLTYDGYTQLEGGEEEELPPAPATPAPAPAPVYDDPYATGDAYSTGAYAPEEVWTEPAPYVPPDVPPPTDPAPYTAPYVAPTPGSAPTPDSDGGAGTGYFEPPRAWDDNTVLFEDGSSGAGPYRSDAYGRVPIRLHGVDDFSQQREPTFDLSTAIPFPQIESPRPPTTPYPATYVPSWYRPPDSFPAEDER